MMLGISGRITILAATMAVFVGCGKSEYEALMNSQMRRLSFASKFLESLHQEEEELFVGVTMQLPSYFDDDKTQFLTGARDRRSDPISPQRIQPPFLKIPGFQYCYEQFVEVGGRNSHPIYCYVASVPVKGQKQAALLARIQAEVRRTSRTAAWQDVQLDDPIGGKMAFKKLSVRSTQAFEMSSEGGDVQDVAGQFDLYVHSAPGWHVIVGFRGTDEVASKVNLFEKAALAMGTLKVESTEDDAEA